MVFIFIAGASGSGKSTLAHMLNEQLHQQNKTSQVLSIDDYFLEIPDGVDLDYYRTHTNFASLEMIDTDLLQKHLLDLNNGSPINKPVFNLTKNRRVKTEIICPKEYLIIEGTFALDIDKKLTNESIKKITVFIGQSSYLQTLKNRIARDEKSRNRTSETVLAEERIYLGPAFFRTMTKNKHNVDIEILNDPLLDQNKLNPMMAGIDEIISALTGITNLNHDF